METEPTPTGKPSSLLIIAVVVCVLLAVAAVVAMMVPSGDQGQSKDPGTPVDVSDDPAAITGVPVVGSAVSASFGEGDAGRPVLSCTVTLDGVPPDRGTVVHLVMSGKGTGPTPLLHPGEKAVDGQVGPGDGPPSEFSATQSIATPDGDYSCEVAAVMTTYGPAELEGQTRASVSA